MSYFNYVYQPIVSSVVVCLLVIFSLPACSLMNSKNDDDTNSNYRENYEQWQTTDFAEYNFIIDRSCFCGGEPYPAQIFVKADTISLVVDPDSQEPVSIDSTQTYADIYPTIEDLFDLIRDAIERDADRLEVTYDNITGFPRLIDIDYSKEIADEEIRYEITSLSGSSKPYPI